MHPFDDRDGAALTRARAAGADDPDDPRRDRRRSSAERVHAATPDSWSTGPAFIDTPQAGAGRRCSSRSRASASTATTSRPRRVDGRRRSGARLAAGRRCRRSWSPTRRRALAALAHARRRPAAGRDASSRSPARRARPAPRTCWRRCSPTAGPTVATAAPSTTSSGCPLTVLRARPGTRYLVLEMGARGLGHIAELCAIAPPRRRRWCSTSAAPTSASSAVAGRSRRPRASWSRRCPPGRASPCSTPTTRWWPRWRPARRARVVHVRHGRPTPTSGWSRPRARRPRAGRASTSCTRGCAAHVHAAAGRRAPGAQRAPPRPRPRSRSACRSTTSPPRSARAHRALALADGGAPSGPTA